MKIKLLLSLSLFISVLSCSTRISEDYFHNFYAERQNTLNGLISGEHAPLKPDDLKGIQYFEYNPEFRFNAIFVASEDSQPFEMTTYAGKTKTFVEKGVLKFKYGGQSRTIHVYQNIRLAKHPVYGKYYFIPFTDQTTAVSTYGGGRYMDIPKSLFESGKVLLDFNSAYNPWCAYSDGFNCPIPPKANDLAIAVEAGEKQFESDKH